MLVGSKQRLNRTGNIHISLNGEIVESVQNFKYLGMILDQQLHFHSHVEHIVDKTTSRLGLLYKTRALFDEETAVMLYKALITPTLITVAYYTR